MQNRYVKSVNSHINSSGPMWLKFCMKAITWSSYGMDCKCEMVDVVMCRRNQTKCLFCIWRSSSNPDDMYFLVPVSFWAFVIMKSNFDCPKKFGPILVHGAIVEKQRYEICQFQQKFQWPNVAQCGPMWPNCGLVYGAQCC